MAEKGYRDLVADAKKHITEISPTDAAAKAKSTSDAVIVDVREKDEFDEDHIPDAVHMSRGMLEFEIEDKFPDRNTTIICHCGGGGRSALAAETLQKMGYKNPISLDGGWRARSAAVRVASAASLIPESTGPLSSSPWTASNIAANRGLLASTRCIGGCSYAVPLARRPS